jgi:hypothetical protein
VSAHSAGYQAGQFIGYFIPLAIGVAKVPGWPIIIGFVLSVVSCVSVQNPSRQDQAGASAKPVEENANEVDLYVGVAEPEYPDEIDPAVLQQFQRDVTRGLESQFAEKLGSIESNISTTSMGGKTIIIYKAIGSLGPHLNQYVGVVNGRRNVVTCVSPSEKPFEECLAKATEVFGKP